MKYWLVFFDYEDPEAFNITHSRLIFCETEEQAIKLFKKWEKVKGVDRDEDSDYDDGFNDGEYVAHEFKLKTVESIRKYIKRKLLKIKRSQLKK